MDPVARLIVAHGGALTILIESGVVLVVVGGAFVIWLRERRRRLRKEAGQARMRE